MIDCQEVIRLRYISINATLFIIMFMMHIMVRRGVCMLRVLNIRAGTYINMKERGSVNGLEPKFNIIQSNFILCIFDEFVQILCRPSVLHDIRNNLSLLRSPF